MGCWLCSAHGGKCPLVCLQTWWGGLKETHIGPGAKVVNMWKNRDNTLERSLELRVLQAGGEHLFNGNVNQ